MEELVEAVLAGVEDAKSKGKRTYTYILPDDNCGCNVTLASLVEQRLPGHFLNYMTITHVNGWVEKRVIVNW